MTINEERLWDILMWLDTFNPEDIAAAEVKFSFNLPSRMFYDQDV